VIIAPPGGAAAATQEAAAGQKGEIRLVRLDNGLRVLVPPFISAGEKIVVSTDEVAYVRRAD
jgi:hypothetical protein